MQFKTLHSLSLVRAASLAALTFIGAAPAVAKTPADTLVEAKNIDDIVSLDPAEVYEITGGEIINNVYDRLFTFKPSDFTKLVGGIVDTWTAADDGLTYDFKIRQGLKFQSGNAVTAEDAAFSLQRVVILNKTPAFILTQFGWSADNVKQRVVAKDKDTLEIKLETPFAPSFILNVLSAGVASVVDKTETLAHEKDGDLGYEWLKTHSAASGAYKIVAWKPKESVALEANPNFYLGAPKLQRIVYRHVPESSAQSLLLQKGDIDIARNLSADQIKALNGNPDITVQTEAKQNFLYIGLNQKYEPLKKPEVLEAIRWLIDYQGLADSVFQGQWKVHQAFVGSGVAGALDDTPYKLDVEKAKKLLADAGYKDGFDLEIDSPNSSPYVEIAQSIQATFSAAGIRVKLLQADQKQVYTKVRARGHQAVIGFWSPDYLDPNSTADWFASNSDNSDNSQHRTAAWRHNFVAPELIKTAEAALLERDDAKRIAAYINLERKIQTESPFVIAFQQTEQAALRKDVKGLVLGPSFDTPVFWQISK